MLDSCPASGEGAAPNSGTPWPRSRLPWVFCQKQLPDESPNPLYLDSTRRGLQPTWPDGQPMYLQTGTPFYAAAYGQASWEPADGNRGFNATLDGRPHGAVHNDTGNGDGLISNTGWMQNTQTAGFDPIFWLHHSEIDRFWVGWNAAGGQNPDDQTDPNWATASDDEVDGTPIVGRWNFWADGNLDNLIVVKPGEMLDPANLDASKFPYSYEYQELPQVPAPRQAGRAAVADAVPERAVPAEPRPLAAPTAAAAGDEVAASEESVEVGHEPVTINVSVSDRGTELLRMFDAPDEGPQRVVLHLEQITTQGSPGNYEVYLNTTDVGRGTVGDDPHFVGLFSAFGANHRHGEHLHGVDASYDITDLVAYLRGQGEWNESNVAVTFVPAVPEVEGLQPLTSPVTVGRIRIETQ